MMQKRNSYLATAVAIILVVVAISCSNSKQASVPCPDFSNKRSYQSGNFHKHKSQNRPMSQRNKVNSFNNTVQQESLPKKLNDSYAESTETSLSTAKQSSNEIQNTDAGRMAYLEGLTASLDNPIDPFTPDYATLADDSVQQACDTIVFKMGNRIIGQVMEIGQSAIKYRDCDNPSGPVFTVLLSDVYVIKHPDGTRDYFHSESPNISQQSSKTSGQNYITNQRTEGLGLAGFIAGVVGLFIFGFPLGAVAIVFGIISLAKIKRHPDRYKGKGFATASLILGLVGVIGLALLLATM